MLTCNALVLCHMSFVAKDGKKVERTKILINLGNYGVYEVFMPLDASLKEFSEIKVKVGYKYNKFVFDSIVK